MQSICGNKITKAVCHRLALASVLALLVLMATGCVDKYEPTKSIDGIFRPSGCVRFVSRSPGWFWMESNEVTLCKPVRVGELGIMTYGWEVAVPGSKAEVGRVEFSDKDYYIDTQSFRGYGQFEYQERKPTFADWRRNHPGQFAFYVFLGIIAVGGIFIGLISLGNRRANKRRRLASEADAKAAAEAAAKAAAKAARFAALKTLKRLVAEAQVAASSLPIILGEAEMAVDRAQDELTCKLYSPFWEAMEEAAAKLGTFEEALSLINARRTTYQNQSAQLRGEIPQFNLGVSVLPDPTFTNIGLNLLYRKAQADPHFAIVYEQRRTNAILIAGFRSLGQAIERLGDRIVNEVSSLAESLDCKLASLESSLESAATAAAVQGSALRAELQHSHKADEAVLKQLRQDAETRFKNEISALRMLDNIQRRKEPSIWD